MKKSDLKFAVGYVVAVTIFFGGFWYFTPKGGDLRVKPVERVHEYYLQKYRCNYAGCHWETLKKVNKDGTDANN